jgi:hypothetical protein
LAHIGRAPCNDVVIVDGSVSETHAELQRREDSWNLMDLDSTNGTYAGGGRLSSEFRLTAGADAPWSAPAVEKQEPAGLSRSLLLVVAAALGFATYLLVRGGSR